MGKILDYDEFYIIEYRLYFRVHCYVLETFQYGWYNVYVQNMWDFWITNQIYVITKLRNKFYIVFGILKKYTCLEEERKE